MRKWCRSFAVSLALSSACATAAPHSFFTNIGMGKEGDWIGGLGMGLTLNPTSFLFTPQLEYVYRPNIYLGPMIQLAPEEDGVLISFSCTVRTWLGKHPHVKPTVEGGLGFAVASSAGGSSSFGVNLSFGMGVDYLVQNNLTIGTMVRSNFAPPVKTFYLSWPLLAVRYIL